MKDFKIVVLISGNGSNLQAIIDRIQMEKCPAVVKAVISNKENAYGLERAKQAGLETGVLDHFHYETREAFDQALIQCIDQYQPDLVVLAGFMRVLTTAFVNHYLGRLINIHPSLLPKYPGLNTHQRALEAGDKTHGCSVHFVTPELDGGPLIAQAITDISNISEVELLRKEVGRLEHIIYPLVITWFIQRQLALVGNHVYLDGKLLPKTGYIYEEN